MTAHDRKIRQEKKMKKIFLLCTAIWLLAAAVFLLGEDAVRLDAERRPKIIKKVSPIFPEEAKKQGIQGLVELETTINTSGDVVAIKVLSNQDPKLLLVQAAIEALQQWKYEPYMINGKAKPVTFTVNVNFVLHEKKGKKTLPDSSQGSSENPADLVRPNKISGIAPVYPIEALQQKIQGVVKIETTTDETGRVVSAKALPSETPQPLLEEAALTAVRQWKYEPFLKEGKAFSITFIVTVTFALQ
jgi:TonB family protein